MRVYAAKNIAVKLKGIENKNYIHAINRRPARI